MVVAGLDLAMGWPAGVECAPVPGDAPAPLAPRAALAGALRSALLNQPVAVAFSGGVDSSLLLALAVEVARAEGLPPPVALTLVFPGDRDAAESQWQECVVRSIGGVDWERIEIVDELDVVGPFARVQLARHGVVWPFLAHTNAPLLARVTGGSLITGDGGDEVLGSHRASVVAGIRRRRIPVRIDTLAAAADGLAPAFVRRARAQRHARGARPWLRPAARSRAAALLGADEAGVPLGFAAALRYDERQRARRAGLQTLGALAAAAGVRLVTPLLSPEFERALIARGGRFGWIDRTDLVHDLFADLLPPEVRERRTKASFHRAYFAEPSRELVRRWDGRLPEAVSALVDGDRLRAEWQAPRPHPSSFGLLQAVALREMEAGRCA